VESVGGEKSPFVAVSVEHSESDSVAATSEGMLEEFNAIGKQIVGEVTSWLHRFGGSQLFHGLRKLVLEVRGEWCLWVEPVLCEREPVVWGRQWQPLGKVAGEFVLVRSSRSPPWYCFPYFQFFVKNLLRMIIFRFILV
jgi:hypothetical protein